MDRMENGLILIFVSVILHVQVSPSIVFGVAGADSIVGFVVASDFHGRFSAVTLWFIKGLQDIIKVKEGENSRSRYNVVEFTRRTEFTFLRCGHYSVMGSG